MTYRLNSSLMQIAFVVENLHEAIARWGRELGDAIDRFGFRAQHIGAVSDDLESESARFAATPGGAIELIRESEALRGGFAALKAAAAHWDGKDP